MKKLDADGLFKDNQKAMIPWYSPPIQRQPDTFYEFSQPLMRQLGWPTLFCNSLTIEETGRVSSYSLRQKDQKRQAVLGLQTLYYRTIAAGDSYNDISMLHQADAGILFRAPQSVIDKFPHLPVAHNYQQLKLEFIKASNRSLSS